MNTRRQFCRIALVLLFGAGVIRAQELNPHIGYVFPAGARAGSTVQVVIGGQFLDGVTNAFVTGEGFAATIVEHWKPLTQQQFNKLREELQELQKKRAASSKVRGQGRSGWTAQEEKTFNEIRKKLAGFQRRPQNPAIAEKVTVKLVVDPKATVGTHEVRLLSALGLSNPLLFQVNCLPELMEKEAPPPEDSFAARRQRNPDDPPELGPQVQTAVTLPAIINGRIMPGDTDTFRFQAAKGQHLVFRACARELVPYLPDAVPGWFQATLSLRDAKGKEIAYDDDFRFQPDPILHMEVPADGEYVLEIKDAIYRGREDFVYRIEAGELPYIASIFPLGQQRDHAAEVELTGWNLPVGKLVVRNGELDPESHGIQVKAAGFISNRMPFAVDDLPDVVEHEPNNAQSEPQKLTIGTIVNGRIGSAGDCDVFSFEGRAGQLIIGEVFARRLDSPLDSVLKLTDAAGRQIAFSDDCEDLASGLYTHHADSCLSATLPASGTYYLQVSDTTRKGGLEYGYRLRVSEPRPDFALRVVPSSPTIRAGLTVPLTVYAMRRDGFTNAIEIALAEAPPGYSLQGARIPANQDKVRLTLTATASTSRIPVTLTMEGRAVVNEKPIVRPVVPAEDMMQAFFYRHLVPAQQMQVVVMSRFMPRSGPGVQQRGPVSIPLGGSATVKLASAGYGLVDRFEFELSDPPEGISLGEVKNTKDGAEMLVKCDSSKAKPGLSGNLIVSVSGKGSQAGKNKQKAGPNQARRVSGYLPAIPFQVVEK